MPLLYSKLPYIKQPFIPKAPVPYVIVVKIHLNKATIRKDVFHEVEHSEPILAEKELVIVSQQILHGFLTSLHFDYKRWSIRHLNKVFLADFCFHFCIWFCSQCQAIKIISRKLQKSNHVQRNLMHLEPILQLITFNELNINCFKRGLFIAYLLFHNKWQI